MVAIGTRIAKIVGVVVYYYGRKILREKIEMEEKEEL